MSPELGKYVDKAAKAYIDKLLEPSPLYELLLKKGKINKISWGDKVNYSSWSSLQ